MINESDLPLEACGVSVQFEGLIALNDVHLALKPRQILGLIGPNGAGKTTLVNVFSGLQKPSSGEVRISGHNIVGWPVHAVARSGVARTFQGVRLFRNLTVWENVAAGAVGAGLPMRRVSEITSGVLDWMGLTSQSHIRAASLPYGAERRIGIARALTMSPRFLLLDEPAAGLNESECDELAPLIASIPKQFGCGVLLIEHNMRVVVRTCETLHVLDGGRTIREGDVDTVRNDPEVIRAYFGTTTVTRRAARG
jgi:branched-chain amino acid transport system ATP-binding protein